jgi:hypothetical protein
MHERGRGVERCLASSVAKAIKDKCEADSAGTSRGLLSPRERLVLRLRKATATQRWPPLRPRIPLRQGYGGQERGSAPGGRTFLETVPYRASRRNAFTPFCTSRIMAAPEPSRSTPRSSLSADADVRSTRHTRVASAPFTWIGHNWWNETKA